jgi:hypothetical protein
LDLKRIFVSIEGHVFPLNKKLDVEAIIAFVYKDSFGF